MDSFFLSSLGKALYTKLTDNTVAMVMYCRKGLTQTILMTYLICLGLFNLARGHRSYFISGEEGGGVESLLK